jgi:thymidine phosphorylase
VDPRVGVVLARKPGDPVKKGEPLAHVHANGRRAARAAVAQVAQAFRIGRGAPASRTLIISRGP